MGDEAKVCQRSARWSPRGVDKPNQRTSFNFNPNFVYPHHLHPSKNNNNKKKTLKKNPALLTPAKTKTQHTFCPSSHHNEKVLLILLFLSLSQLLRHRQEACLLQKPHKDLCTPSLSNGFLNFTGHTCTKYKRFTFKRPLRQKNSSGFSHSRRLAASKQFSLSHFLPPACQRVQP